MILSYQEIREDMLECFERLHVRSNYDVKNTFYATLGDYEYSDEYSSIDEVCIYVAFTAMLIDKDIKYDFLKEKLKELIHIDLVDSYSGELGDEFLDFMNDVELIKRNR